MLDKSQIGQLLSDQIGSYITSNAGRKPALIEPDVYDDEAGIGFDPLDRWGDRKFNLKQHNWRD